MARTHDGEVPVIERRDCFEAESLNHRDDGGVGSAEGQIGVGLCQLDDAREIGLGHRFDSKPVAAQHPEEVGLRCRTQVLADEIADLSDHKRWDDKRRFCGSQLIEARLVVAVPVVGGRVDRAGVEEKCYRPKPSARRASMRSDWARSLP